MTAEQRETYEERAAIMEYDGGLPRAEAERAARRIAEGRADEPEQLDMPLDNFRAEMRRLWRDY